MKNKLFKSLGLVLSGIIVRSLYLHKDLYFRIWEENKTTVIFLVSIFFLLVFMVTRFQGVEDTHND
ncbi:hypothetical protein [Autumnicola musiva]|uniref:Uncharacterized protein n=1 Tax=Autumnicola musiva TaxID=3075589 RepID=A0ABU3DAV8_9FLAO|nr:hypothetical protein [Zunongwangia sp. F117]MDT0678654.1 hypothetical protein [Zunongwangia sp. F117]